MSSQLTFNEIRQENEDARRLVIESHRGYKTVRQSWLDPGEHDEIVGVDFGSGSAWLHFLRANLDEQVTAEALPLRLMSLARRSAVVGELAHLGRAQTSQSKAQPYTAETLLGLYPALEENGVTLRLAPHQHSRRMREWSAKHFPTLVTAEKTSDANDARAIACYVQHKNCLSLMRPPRTFDRSPASLYGDLVRAESNVVLNDASSRGYEGEVHPAISYLAAAIASRVERPGCFVNHKIAFSIASLITSERDGIPVRFVLNGKPPGWRKFKKYVLKSSPFHQKGGRARSNIFWHTFRPFMERLAGTVGESVKVGGKSYVRHAEYSEDQEAVKKYAMRQLREEIAAAYRLAVEMTAGLECFEILNEEMEGAINGR
jgi:hypothetical protein